MCRFFMCIVARMTHSNAEVGFSPILQNRKLRFRKGK